MKDTLILEGKNYISARRAAKIINYAQDYIGQLCRSGKLDCRMVGRSWFVTEESLLTHRQSAVDSISQKMVKNIDEENIKKDALNSSILSNISLSPALSVTPRQNSNQEISAVPVVSEKVSEKENVHFLPALKKRLPMNFSLPKSISDISLSPFLYFDARKASLFNTTLVVLVVSAITISGIIFTISLSPAKYANSVSSQASVISLTKEIVNKIIGGFDTMSSHLSLYFAYDKNTSDKIYSDVPQNSFGTTTAFVNLNGIGIVPSSQSVLADEQSKLKIRNTFSDEVSIHSDKSGTAGIITPVFKKNDGDDFVYVLVPVKEADNKKGTETNKVGSQQDENKK